MTPTATRKSLWLTPEQAFAVIAWGATIMARKGIPVTRETLGDQLFVTDEDLDGLLERAGMTFEQVRDKAAEVSPVFPAVMRS